MSNGEHEIRTPKGLRIGNRSVVDGKNMLQIKCGGCEDYISAESLVECINHVAKEQKKIGKLYLIFYVKISKVMQNMVRRDSNMKFLK